MKYTIRFAHLFEPSSLKIGDSICFGNLIGIMGSTGQSKFNHLHIDCVEGFVEKIIRLNEIGENKKYKSCKKQLDFFIDKDLFKYDFAITTSYLDKEYEFIYGKKHPAIDIVPQDRHITNEHFKIYWNRLKVKNTEVLINTFDEGGYGNVVAIGFETYD